MRMQLLRLRDLSLAMTVAFGFLLYELTTSAIGPPMFRDLKRHVNRLLGHQFDDPSGGHIALAVLGIFVSGLLFVCVRFLLRRFRYRWIPTILCLTALIGVSPLVWFGSTGGRGMQFSSATLLVIVSGIVIALTPLWSERRLLSASMFGIALLTYSAYWSWLYQREFQSAMMLTVPLLGFVTGFMWRLAEPSR